MKQANARSTLRRDQRGLSTVEYTVLLVLILAGAITLWKQLGGDVRTKLQSSVNAFKQVQVPGGGGGAGGLTGALGGSP
jgi:Flp pilus assembly pilin Flp